ERSPDVAEPQDPTEGRRRAGTAHQGPQVPPPPAWPQQGGESLVQPAAAPSPEAHGGRLMPFIEFSTALSLDFGRRRKTQLPDGLTREEIEYEEDPDEPEGPEKPGPKLGFQPNEEKD